MLIGEEDCQLTHVCNGQPSAGAPDFLSPQNHVIGKFHASSSLGVWPYFWTEEEQGTVGALYAVLLKVFLIICLSNVVTTEKQPDNKRQDMHKAPDHAKEKHKIK